MVRSFLLLFLLAASSASAENDPAAGSAGDTPAATVATLGI